MTSSQSTTALNVLLSFCRAPIHLTPSSANNKYTAHTCRKIITARTSLLLLTIFITLFLASLLILWPFNNSSLPNSLDALPFVSSDSFPLPPDIVSSSSVSSPPPQPPLQDQDTNVEEGRQLDELLRKAALPNKTVIFTSVNAAWAENGSLFDIFMEAFQILNNSEKGLMNHLIVLAFDENSYNRCMELHTLCYQLKTEGVDLSSAKAYMTPDYLKMMWRRIKFLRDVLVQGYSFIFTDVDIVWLRDPFPLLLKDEDFQIACDRFNGDAKSLDNAPNGGFVFARSNERTISFFKFWYNSRLTYPSKHDQDVFIEIRHDTKTLEGIGVNIAYLDTNYFVSFCTYQKFNISLSSTVHSNCCNGRHNKERNLRMILRDWEEFISNGTKLQTWVRPEGCTFESVP